MYGVVSSRIKRHGDAADDADMWWRRVTSLNPGAGNMEALGITRRLIADLDDEIAALERKVAELTARRDALATARDDLRGWADHQDPSRRTPDSPPAKRPADT